MKCGIVYTLQGISGVSYELRADTEHELDRIIACMTGGSEGDEVISAYFPKRYLDGEWYTRELKQATMTKQVTALDNPKVKRKALPVVVGVYLYFL